MTCFSAGRHSIGGRCLVAPAFQVNSLIQRFSRTFEPVEFLIEISQRIKVVTHPFSTESLLASLFASDRLTGPLQRGGRCLSAPVFQVNNLSQHFFRMFEPIEFFREIARNI
jgi:hypothetical protein